MMMPSPLIVDMFSSAYPCVICHALTTQGVIIFRAPMCSKDCLHKFTLKLEAENQRQQQALDRLKRLIGFAGTVLALTLVTLIMQRMFPEYRKLSHYVALLGNGAYAVISTRMAIRDWREKHPGKLIAMSLFTGAINFASAIWNLYLLIW